MVDSSFRVSTRHLNSALDNVNKSLNKLASGKRINSAADDPAGLAIAEQLASEAATFKQASNNAGYGLSYLNVQDGALEQVSQISTRLQELSVQSANGTLSDDQRGSLKQEYDALSAEAERIVASTEFNGQKVFSGSSTTLQVGVDSGSDSQITIQGTEVATQLANLKAQNIGTQAGAQIALDAAKAFSTNITQERGKLGAVVSRLETAVNNISVATENLQSAESRIRDVDVADEVARKVSESIRANAGTAAYVHSKNLSANKVLGLLK